MTAKFLFKQSQKDCFFGLMPFDEKYYQKKYRTAVEDARKFLMSAEKSHSEIMILDKKDTHCS